MYPKKGQKFTISANKIDNGDRSYTQEILECKDANDISVLCLEKDGEEIILVKSEHDFALMPLEQEEPKDPEFRPVKDQAVLVRDDEFSLWEKRFSTGERSSAGKYGAYNGGGNSYHETDTTRYWDECKPDTMSPTMINWIEHDGTYKCPVGDNVSFLLEFKLPSEDGNRMAIHENSKNTAWYCAIRYLIIGNP